MIEFFNNRILSYGNCPSGELKKLSVITPENHLNEYGVSNWLWPDYPKGEPIYSPQEYTGEQLEEKRNQYVKAEIEALYPQDIQLKIMMEKDEKPEVYEQLQADRSRIKAESKEKDFQIKASQG